MATEPRGVLLLVSLCSVLAGCDASVVDGPSDARTSASLAGSAAFTVVLDPVGDNGNAGTSAAPILTMNRVNDLLHEWKGGTLRPGDPVYPANVDVSVNPGTYYGHQHVSWTFTFPDSADGPVYTVRIHATNPKNAPEFNGCSALGCKDEVRAGLFDYETGYKDVFFYGDFRSASLYGGKSVSFSFESIRIKNYVAAIRIFWNKDAPATNVVENCQFENIGNRLEQNDNVTYVHDAPRTQPQDDAFDAVAAVSIWGAGNGLIVNNTFTNIIRRSPSQPASERRMHAIYLDQSSANQIRGNQFQFVSGLSISLRNGSDENTIIGNSFDQAGTFYRTIPLVAVAAYEDSTEVPSTDTVFTKNALGQVFPEPDTSGGVMCTDVTLCTVKDVVSGEGGLYWLAPSGSTVEDACNFPSPRGAPLDRYNTRLASPSACKPIP